jgi:hypothetical protein
MKLLPGESIGADRFSPGDKVVWNRSMRGGYGYTQRILCTVVATNATRVKVQSTVLGTRWVSPWTLTPADPAAQGSATKEGTP